MSQIVRQKISAVRTKHRAVALCTGVAMIVALCVLVLIASAIVDWLFDLPLVWREILLVANGVLALYCLTRYALLPIARGGDDESLALAIERVFPSYGSRLIAAVQFSRPNMLTAGESGVLVQAMITQTESLVARADFLPVISTSQLRRWGSAAACVAVFSVGLVALGGETSRVLLQRAFLAPIALPAKTHVEVLSGSFLVAQGERATLSAKAIGWHPDAGTAEIVYASGRKQTIAMERSKEDRDIYNANLEAVQESFDYRIRLYDGISDKFDVTTEIRPTVLVLNCTQIYPAYTNLGEMPRQTTDLLLLAGSKLRLNIQTNKPLAVNNKAAPVNAVQLVTRSAASADGTATTTAPIALVSSPNDPRKWSAEFALPENLAGFTIHLRDANGLESKNPPFYAVDVLPDRPPDIHLTAPDRRDILVTSEATCTVGFVAEDDYGLASIVLHYKIDEDAEHSIPLAIHAGDKQLKAFYPWDISKLPPPSGKPSLEGCVIEFYVEAKDANDVSGPGITATEHYQLRVVSKADKQAELIARMAESFGTIHDVTDRQENAASELGSLITEQPGLNRPRPAAPRP